MKSRRNGSLGLLALTAVVLLAPAAADAQVQAGVAKVDASWHVGASAGQYAGDCATDPPTTAIEEEDPEAGVNEACAFGVDPADGTYDPTTHSYRRQKSYGLQSRLDVRALVIDGGAAPIAIVKTNQYIPQDLLYRRAAQLLEESGEDCGVTRGTLTMASTHNHSSPMYSSTSWGVWAFQDVFDVRFYNYLAERIAAAVTEACQGLVPVRVGASVGSFDKTHRHSFGPAIADDGTPAGYPNDETDHDMTVIRFDKVDGTPLANLVNFSLHPEFLEGNDLLSADYIAPLERITDEATGAMTIFTQGAVGTAEPERSTYHSIHERLEFTHKDYAQAEYGASLMSGEIVDIWDDIAARTPDDASRFVPFATDFPVAMQDKWYPGPLSHPYPGVSNCRTDPALAGDPKVPVAGLPDCTSLRESLDDIDSELEKNGFPVDVPISRGEFPIDPGLDTDDFEQAGIPVPENYSAPSYTGLEEDINVHLQGIRLGEIYLPICSCEQWFDQSKNIETRTDRELDNDWLGYDWAAQCTRNPGDPPGSTYEAADGSGTGTWLCPNPGNTNQNLPPVTDAEYVRMRAQVYEPANGWNDLENVPYAESEDPDLGDPAEPDDDKFWGNFTHDDACGPDSNTPGDEPCEPGEISASVKDGYTLTVPISMANDYNGYIASYREYQRGDHYRKALTGWGPHASDYMASRLVTIGRQLKNQASPLPADQQFERDNLQAKVDADLAVNDQRAKALGEVGTALTEQYEDRLPDDGGEAEAVSEPEDVERFDAAFFTWNGGSNYTDDPRVSVQRHVSGDWEPYADQSGEIPVTLEFPEGADSAPVYLSGGQEWRWTAHFEAFVAPFDVGSDIATPAGRYRFVISGERREGGAVVPYEVISNEFEVKPWDGITVESLRQEPDGRVSFEVGPTNTFGAGGGVESEIGPVDYPDTYDDPQRARFIRYQRTALRDPADPANGELVEWFCFTCSFRPWLDAGDAVTAEFTFFSAAGGLESVPAVQEGDRWVSERPLAEGESAFVDRGCVRDEYGNANGAATGAVGASDEAPAGAPGCEPVVDEEAPPGDEEALPGDNGTRPGGTPPGGPGGALPAPSPGGRPKIDCEKGTRRADRIKGGAKDDCLKGGGGNDRLKGGRGNDLLSGGPGNDRIVAGAGIDSVSCGPGRDTARVDELDSVSGCEKVRGRG